MLPAGGELTVDAGLGRFEDRTFGSVAGDARWALRDLERRWLAEISVGAGALTREAPVQSLYLLGGRWTLPGQDYRAFVGDRYWLVRGEVTIPVVPPWLGLRLIGGVGATYLDDRGLPADWIRQDSSGLRGSLGAGLSIGWDSVRLDLAHGVRGGGWEAVFSVAEQFRDWL
jgi:hypothetical protein